MSDVAIRIEGLGKRYRLGQRQRYKTLRDTIADAVGRPLRAAASTFNGSHQNGRESRGTFWALRDVSCEIKRGDVVGVIGRNGAGKSTLLKLLSRITEPTQGYAEIRGRVGSLLEVGTGFHPELTGRENVYLNGAVLGMRKAEIDRKFDEIVAFAEVERFLDTPVKYYSDGMHVRLAFAVAAHLEPEILFIDEVLAVGDVAFQKRCMGRMERVAGEGTTVVVVSHSMNTIKALCSNALLLEQGTLRAFGSASDVAAEYLNSHQVDSTEKIISDSDHATGVKEIRVRCLRLLDGIGESFSVYWQQPITIVAELQVLQPVHDVAFGAGIRTMDGMPLFTVQHDDGGETLWAFEPGEYRVTFTFENNLRPGLYKLHLGADHSHIRLKNIVALDVVTLEVLEYTQEGVTASASNSGFVNGQATWQVDALRKARVG